MGQGANYAWAMPLGISHKDYERKHSVTTELIERQRQRQMNGMEKESLRLSGHCERDKNSIKITAMMLMR
jgi:hypothetical protein